MTRLFAKIVATGSRNFWRTFIYAIISCLGCASGCSSDSHRSVGAAHSESPRDAAVACSVTPCPQGEAFTTASCRCEAANGVNDAASMECDLIPCPHGNAINPATCACEALPDAGPGAKTSTTCDLIPCPFGNSVNPQTCRCEQVGDTDSGG